MNVDTTFPRKEDIQRLRIEQTLQEAQKCLVAGRGSFDVPAKRQMSQGDINFVVDCIRAAKWDVKVAERPLSMGSAWTVLFGEEKDRLEGFEGVLVRTYRTLRRQLILAQNGRPEPDVDRLRDETFDFRRLIPHADADDMDAEFVKTQRAMGEVPDLLVDENGDLLFLATPRR